MATEVMLPDLGEGIEDVTISRWLVAEGEEVQAGEPLLEVATDKVDTAVPAPASGTVLIHKFSEGEIAPVQAVLAVIGSAGEEISAAAPISAEPAPQAAPAESAHPGSGAGNEKPRATPVAQRIAQEQGIDLDRVSGSGAGGKITKEDVLAFGSDRPQAGEAGAAHGAGDAAATQSTTLPGALANVVPPVVARMAAEFGVDLAEVAGSRPLSSLTKYDVLSAVASRAAGEQVVVTPPFQAREAPVPKPAQPAAPAVTTPARTRSAPPEQREELLKHSRMRQLVARNTAQSAFSAPHVTTMWDVSMANVLAHRADHKDEFAQAGVKLTVTPYLVQALLAGLKAVPAANATWTEEGVIIKRFYHIGMAVALPQDANGMGGLTVPVIKNADELNLLGLARAVNDLAQRTRTNQLQVEELQGGTFTLTNYGVSGSRFQTPIIVQPQVGILGVGAIEKRPVVVSQGHPLDPNRGDYLTFMPMATLGFSYDHRVLDGATADAFCAAVKEALESWR